MGEAKKRGSFENRKTQAMEREKARAQEIVEQIKKREAAMTPEERDEQRMKKYIRGKGPVLSFVAALSLANSFEYRKL